MTRRMIRAGALAGFLLAAAGIGPAQPSDSRIDQAARDRLIPSTLQAPGPAAAMNRKMKQ